MNDLNFELHDCKLTFDVSYLLLLCFKLGKDRSKVDNNSSQGDEVIQVNKPVSATLTSLTPNMTIYFEVVF